MEVHMKYTVLYSPFTLCIYIRLNRNRNRNRINLNLFLSLLSISISNEWMNKLSTVRRRRRSPLLYSGPLPCCCWVFYQYAAPARSTPASSMAICWTPNPGGLCPNSYPSSSKIFDKNSDFGSLHAHTSGYSGLSAAAPLSPLLLILSVVTLKISSPHSRTSEWMNRRVPFRPTWINRCLHRPDPASSRYLSTWRGQFWNGS